jgi:spermidine synthase
MSAERQSPLSALQFALLLGVVGFAPVAFLLCLFRLLSFFIMPSLFFHLLFIGFPMGAFLGARFFRVSLSDFCRSLVLLHGMMLVSLALCLLCKQADYLRAQFYDLRADRLLAQVAMFSVMFLPFFCAYGLSEYVGYQTGRQILKGRMHAVYATYLLAAAAGYLAVHYSLSWVGITRIMTGSIACIVFAALVISARRFWLWVQLIVLLAITCWPGVEQRFLDLYKGTYSGASISSTKGMATMVDFRQIYQRWGYYALVELMESPSLRQVLGFYNDVFQWAYNRPYGVPEATLDALPFLLVPDDGRVVIIGSGGGRQVQWAQQFKLREIVAVEIEPEVFRACRQEFADKFDYVYEQPNVTAVRAEGRSYLTSTRDTFDLIFMPSVGGYPQMMLEPGNMIRTLEAYQLMKDRLTPTGVLAVWYPAGLDPEGILTRQYIDTFRSLGLHANAYVRHASGGGEISEILIVSSAVPERAVLPEQAVSELFNAKTGPFDRPQPESTPMLMPYDGDPLFTPITDEKPFLAGNIRHLLTLAQVKTLFGWLALGVAGLGCVIAATLRTQGDPKVPGVPYTALVLASLLVGANFLVMEHALVIAFFHYSYVYYDSLVFAAIAFLVLSGLGSMFINERSRWIAYGIAVLSCGTLLIAGPHMPPLGVAAAIVPAAFALGSYFPSLFETAERNPLAVFAMDAIGAALGSLGAFFVPIVFGLSRLFTVAAVICLCTTFCMALLMSRKKHADVPSRWQ